MNTLFARPLAALPLVFFDLETTGLELRAGHRVCEVAMLRLRGTLIEDCLTATVNPRRRLDAGAAAVNGFTDAELETAPEFASVAGRVAALADGAVLIAHNLPFDMGFLASELTRIGRSPLRSPTLDTLTLARRLMRRQSYSLSSLAAYLELPPPTHRALADVFALRGLFSHLQALMAELGITTLADAIRLERGLLPGAPELRAPALIVQALAEGRALHIQYRSRSSPVPTTRTVRPLYLTHEQSGVFLRAYCELRHAVRAFALDKIETMEIA